MTGAQALVRSLAKAGVEVVFGLPGVQIMALYDALYHEPGIRLVTVRHEQAAVYMADGFARTTGKVGVALVVPGPGALNATAALGTAYAASSPVLLISGQVASADLGKGRGALHEVTDQLEVFRPLTKWSSRILRVEDIPSAAREAMRQLGSGRPRPVELELPPDVLSASAALELLDPEPPSGEGVEPTAIEAAVALLARARRPLVWAGGGVNASGASAELLELASALDAPVITTPEGKGAVPEDHPLSVGVFYYGHGPVRHVLPRADAILAVGSRLFVPDGLPFLESHQALVHVDIDPEELGRTWKPRVGIAADARLALRALRAELADGPRASEWTTAELAAIRAESEEEIRGQAAVPVRIVETLRAVLEPDAIVVSGITSVGYWSNLALPVLRPRSYLTSSYFATLGFAFPTAIGAKIAHPGRQVVALCGDGGFMYALGELATAVQERVGVVALVFNDNAFGASLNDQLTRFEGRIIGTRLHNPDFARVAEAFGAQGMRLSNHEELGEALASALGSKGPVVIEVPIPTVTPPFQMAPKHLSGPSAPP